MVSTLVGLLALAIPGAVLLAFAAVLIGRAWKRRGMPSDDAPTVAVTVIAAILFSLAPAAFLWLFASGMACFDGGPSCVERERLSTLPIAVVSSIVISLIGLAGYLAFARGRGLGAAIAAVVLTPIALGVALAGAGAGSAVVGGFVGGIQQRQDLDAQATRSGSFHVTASNVHATLAADRQSVDAVTLHVVVHADVAVELEQGKEPRPTFTLLAPGSQPTSGRWRGSGPTDFAAGSDTGYDLAFDTKYTGLAPRRGADLASTYSAPRPGTWLLRVEFVDIAGHEYSVDANVEVAGPA